MKNRRNKLCYLCGGNGADTRDHIPPRGIFPKKPSGQLITVPAHKKCNEQFQNDDEIFRNLIIAASFRTMEGKMSWDEIVIKSFHSNPGARKELLKRLKKIYVEDPISGLIIPKYALMLESDLFIRQLRRWTLGLYFKKNNRPLNQDAKINIEKLTVPEISIVGIQHYLYTRFRLSLKWKIVEPNIFVYSYTSSIESKDEVVIFFILFNTEVYMTSININEPLIIVPK